MIEIQKLRTELQSALAKPLPAEKAQQLMAPPFRKVHKLLNVGKTARKAGVMLMLYPHLGTTYTALMRRSEDGRAHSGQISFPGGAYETTDGNLITTALRETEEEFGVNRQHFEILGQLSSLYIPVSNYVVQPLVTIAKKRPIFRPDNVEVSEIIEVDVPYLLQEEIVKIKKIKTRGGLYIKTPHYDIYGNVLWGATAMIMSEFLWLLKNEVAIN